MSRTKQFLIEEIEKIKKEIWEGKLTQQQIAQEAGVSAALVSNISRGFAYYEAKWPNGLTGPNPYPKAGKRTVNIKRPSAMALEGIRRAEAGEFDDLPEFDGEFDASKED